MLLIDRYALSTSTAHFFPTEYVVITYCECLVELKDVNVIHSQTSPFQDLWCAVRWPGRQKKHFAHITDIQKKQ